MIFVFPVPKVYTVMALTGPPSKFFISWPCFLSNVFCLKQSKQDGSLSTAHSATSLQYVVCVVAQLCGFYACLYGRCSEVNECQKCSRNIVQCIFFLFTLKLVCKPAKGHFEPLQIIHISDREGDDFFLSKRSKIMRAQFVYVLKLATARKIGLRLSSAMKLGPGPNFIALLNGRFCAYCMISISKRCSP